MVISTIWRKHLANVFILIINSSREYWLSFWHIFGFFAVVCVTRNVKTWLNLILSFCDLLSPDITCKVLNFTAYKYIFCNGIGIFLLFLENSRSWSLKSDIIGYVELIRFKAVIHMILPPFHFFYSPRFFDFLYYLILSSASWLINIIVWFIKLINIALIL